MIKKIIFIMLAVVSSNVYADDGDRCSEFLLSDYRVSITLNEFCLIGDNEGIENLQYDKVILIYNEKTKQNHVVLFNGRRRALLVDNDLIFVLEEGNEGLGELLEYGVGKLAQWAVDKAEKHLGGMEHRQPDPREYESSDNNDANNRHKDDNESGSNNSNTNA